jgi:hypothetical protein
MASMDIHDYKDGFVYQPKKKNPLQQLACLNKSAEIRSTLEKGGTFLNHFKLKRSNPEPNTENNS